jgi:hypothetical protein
MSDRPSRLPGRQRPSQPPAPALFQPGDRVVLRGCPDTPPGRVRGMRRKKVAVYWSDLRLTTYHHPGSLLLAADAERRVDGSRRL